MLRYAESQFHASTCAFNPFFLSLWAQECAAFAGILVITTEQRLRPGSIYQIAVTRSLCNGNEHPNPTATQGPPLKLVTYSELGGAEQWLAEGSYAADIGNSKTD